MTQYTNKQGDVYMVMRDRKVGKFKVHRARAGWAKFERVPAFPWRETLEEAEADLVKYATEKGLEPFFMLNEESCVESDSTSKPKVMIPRVYRDSRGWVYKVMGGIGEGTFKARYKKPNKGGWKCCSALAWRSTFEEAQADLDAWAKAKGMKEEGELLA